MSTFVSDMEDDDRDNNEAGFLHVNLGAVNVSDVPAFSLFNSLLSDPPQHSQVKILFRSDPTH